MNNADYPDLDNNGVPDAFENRRPIAEILQNEESIRRPTAWFPFFGLPLTVTSSAKMSDSQTPTATLEIETVKRPPKRGEMYFNDHDGRVHIAEYSGSLSKVIVKRIVDAPSYWKPI